MYLKELPDKHSTFIHSDAQEFAESVNLIYVSDNDPGIIRLKKGKGFIYMDNNSIVTNEKIIRRIKKLVIPPAWTNVWICRHENGHIQCTGYDSRNRKQYKYHENWIKNRNETKFFRLLQFGELLPQLRLQVEKDIAQKNLNERKVIATAISVMERTYIRIGNNSYEKIYGSFGLTTLKDKHVKFEGDTVHITFVGKKNVKQHVTLKSRKLARIIKQCRDIPGKELFQYIGEDGKHHSIDSGRVNEYIKAATGKDFTAKDFRTWAGTINALSVFAERGFIEDINNTKKKLIEVIDFVSRKLGNTRTVCRKYYIHPIVIQLYENGLLKQYIDELDKIETDDNKSGLTAIEKLLMKILSLQQQSD
jgi:DNA topoisomerase-1